MAIKKLIIISIIFLGLLASFSFAQTQPIQPPETLEAAKEVGEKAIEVGREEMPGILEKIWKEEVLPIWQKMYSWFKRNIWDSWIGPWLQNIWQKIENILGKEVEKRKPQIKEEFQKEKEEMKKEVPKVTKSLWERFKELIK